MLWSEQTKQMKRSPFACKNEEKCVVMEKTFSKYKEKPQKEKRLKERERKLWYAVKPCPRKRRMAKFVVASVEREIKTHKRAGAEETTGLILMTRVLNQFGFLSCSVFLLLT